MFVYGYICIVYVIILFVITYLNQFFGRGEPKVSPALDIDDEDVYRKRHISISHSFPDTVGGLRPPYDPPPNKKHVI